MITSVDKRLKKWYQKYGDLSPAAKSKLKLLLADFVKSSEQKVSEATVNAVKVVVSVGRVQFFAPNLIILILSDTISQTASQIIRTWS